MSLENIITSSTKEIAGSRTKNRLTIQISYALQLIMEFYSTDFVVMMDYIEDPRIKICLDIGHGVIGGDHKVAAEEEIFLGIAQDVAAV